MSIGSGSAAKNARRRRPLDALHRLAVDTVQVVTDVEVAVATYVVVLDIEVYELVLVTVDVLVAVDVDVVVVVVRDVSKLGDGLFV